MEMESEMEMEMWMEMEMEIFGARKACSQFRFASKLLLTFDFEVLEASGARKGDQGSPTKPPKSSRGALKRLPRGSLEVLWGLLEVQKIPQATILETFIDFRASKNSPRGPQVTIHRPCQRFRASIRGTPELSFRLSRARAPRSRTHFIPLLIIGE